MEPTMEIRKLKPSQVEKMANSLDYGDSWKRLMDIIPEKLDTCAYTCDVSPTNPRKYHSEHFRLIQDHCEKHNISCTKILFDEWGTSGRVRPTLGHLLYLLTKAQLFGGADYVAELLNQDKPKRPQNGPAALVDIDILKMQEQALKKFEDQLNKVNHVEKAREEIFEYEKAIKHKPPPPKTVPRIEISPSIDEDNSRKPSFSGPLVNRKETSTKVINDKSNSSSGSSNDKHVPVVVQQEESSVPSMGTQSEAYIPQIDDLLENSNRSIENSQESNDLNSEQTINSGSSEMSNIDESFRPAISKLLDDSNNQNVANANETSIENISENMPNLDILRSTTNTQDTTSNTESNSNNFLPMISMLNQQVSNAATQSTKVDITVSGQSSSDLIDLKCSSPLPPLSLNTVLPHVTYTNLHSATDNFNEERYVNNNSSGRLLGSGAFGSVFIAFGIEDKPVAVKKLKLDNLVKNVDSVDADDVVTKQFRNEVEVLSKYKHENLLSLLGYSCDGSTYCLIYEYVAGGALKDRLQANEKIQWKDRLNVALGTAKAVSYLHTAFETPLIHRDITSSNILLDSRNNPKLCDFGLIKLSPSDSCTTTIYGTSAYMAPEAFSGDISVKMDTFSFGVVLLELLTSLPPIDQTREERDLCTYIRENCINDDITPFLDATAGSWEDNNVSYAAELFKVSLQCLQVKKKRTLMVDVTDLLEEIIRRLKKIVLY